MVTRDCSYTQPSFCHGYVGPQGERWLWRWPPLAAPGPSATVAKEINSINALAVKLPKLWQSKVWSWFAQTEAQFATSGIRSSLTKYYHVIMALY